MRPRWIFLIAFALVFYGTGAAFIESFVNYASWPLIGADEFVAYHRFISPRVLTFLVAPLLLGTAFTILMLWSRPAAIPPWPVWAAVAAQAVVWVSTVTIQVPIQLQLSNDGLSNDLIGRLIATNFWLRRIPYAVCAGLFLWMAARVMDASDERRAT
jgi:predicted cation transporter